MGEVATRVDMTDRVGAFFETPRTKEVAVVIPGLVMMARDGLIRVSARRHDFDGCHPYEWRETSEQPDMPVEMLRGFGRNAYRERLGSVSLGRGFEKVVDEQFLGSMEFYIDPANVGERIETDEEMTRMICEGPQQFVALSAEHLVGDDSELLVRPRDPLQFPLTIPKHGEFGSTKPVYNTPIDVLTAIDTPEGRQVILRVHDTFRDSVELRPAPADKLEFMIKKIEHTSEWLINQIRRCDHTSDQQFKYINELNEKLADDDTKPVYFRPYFEANSGSRSRRKLVVGKGTDRGIRYSIRTYDFWDHDSYTLGRIISNDDAIFAVDDQENIALPLSQVATSEFDFLK